MGNVFSQFFVIARWGGLLESCVAATGWLVTSFRYKKTYIVWG